MYWNALRLRGRTLYKAFIRVPADCRGFQYILDSADLQALVVDCLGHLFWVEDFVEFFGSEESEFYAGFFQ